MKSTDLHDLFDDAAGGFSPQPDVEHLTSLLQRSRRGRHGVFGIGAVAAAAILTLGGVAALSGDATDEPVSPGDLVELPAVTTVPDTTEPAPPTTVVVVARDVGSSTPDPSRSAATPTAPPSTVEVVAPTTTMPVVTLPATTVVTPPPAQPVTAASTVAPASAPAPAAAAAPTTQAPPPPSTTLAPAPTTHAPTTTHAPATTHAPPTTTGGQVGFTAHQTWGSCGSVPPYEELHGTAAAGSTITVSSPYGSASTTASADGSWYVQVFFSGAPANQPFTITVGSAQGSVTFPFVVTS